MKKNTTSNVIGTLLLIFSVASFASAQTTFVFPGGTATTGLGAWGGTAGTVYPVAFNVDAGPLTVQVNNLNMSGVKFTNINPCCGPGLGLGAYAQVGVAAEAVPRDWPENGVQMFVTSVMGWDKGGGSWNNQAASYTHDSSPGANDGNGYRKYLQQCWYNPINTLDPRPPYDNDFNKWNFQFNAEKFMGGPFNDSEYDTFDLRMKVSSITPKVYRVEWWVRLNKASSWDESNKAANWGCPWNGAKSNAAMGTSDKERVELACIDEVPAETGRVDGAWNRVESPGTPGADYFDVSKVDFSAVSPHVAIHNGGSAANSGHTITWGDTVVTGIPVVQAGAATGGGWFIPEGGSEKATFAFVAKQKNGMTSGQLEFHYKPENVKLKSTALTGVWVTGSAIVFQGEGTLNGSPVTFEVIGADMDKAGGQDRFHINIWNGNGTQIYELEGDVGGGQVACH